MSYPVFMLTRDRLECVKDLTRWLERAGQENIVFLDSGSTYEPLRDWLKDSPHTVHWLTNERSKANSLLWESGLVPDGPFAHVAPDILPTEDCPMDAFEYCWELLDQYSGWRKAGLGILYDDWPPQLEASAAELRLLEGQPIQTDLCSSVIDHTFCVYRGESSADDLNALRTMRPSPYMVRHMPAYETAPFTPDVEHYIKHARGGSNWSTWVKTVGGEG